VRVVKHWHRLLREFAATPSLEIFKAQLGTALGNLLKVTLLDQAAWTRQSPEVPANLNHTVIQKTPA